MIIQERTNASIAIPEAIIIPLLILSESVLSTNAPIKEDNEKKIIPVCMKSRKSDERNLIKYK